MRRLFPTIGALAVLLAALSAEAAEPRHAIRIGTVGALAGEMVDLELRVETPPPGIAAIAFIIDYDETRLRLGEESAKQPRIQIDLPTEFSSSIFYLSDATGKIGISFYDAEAPVAALADVVTARLRFRVRPDAAGFAGVGLDSASAPTAADRAGNSVDGPFVTTAGGVAIRARRGDLVTSPRAVGFGSVPAGRDTSRVITVANAGNAPIPISAIRLENGNAGFTITPATAPAALGAGGSMAIEIRFRSDAIGDFEDRLLVVPSSGAPVAVALSASTRPEGLFSYDWKRVVPAVASATGSERTTWRSSLTLHNSLDEPAGARITLTRNDGVVLGVSEIVVAPHETAAYADVVAELFHETHTIGSLLVESSTPDLLIRSATSSVRGDGGTSAQNVPALDWRDLFRGEPAYLTGLERSAARRTNIGLLNLSSEPAVLRVALLTGRGEPIGTRDYALSPGQLLASIDLFDALGVPAAENLTAIVRPMTPDTTFYAYASTVDNRTAAPLFQSAR